MGHIDGLVQPVWLGHHTTEQLRSPVSLGILPCELVLEIADYLEIGSLSRLSRTCRGLHRLLDAEITKQAQQSSLAPRSHYEASFFYDDDHQHGVDFPSFRVHWDPTFDHSVASCRRWIPPAFIPTRFEPFGQAIYRGNFAAVKNLLERGVNPNSYLVNGATMLSIAGIG